ncbi:MAG: hypothetical protein HRU20_31715 [Pseudomonadales bacterium]|nr:hypothetical protein [Pseudomonadales bacterium]
MGLKLDWFDELKDDAFDAYKANQATKMEQAKAKQAQMVAAVPLVTNPQARPVPVRISAAAVPSAGFVMPQYAGLAAGAIGVLLVALVLVRK